MKATPVLSVISLAGLAAIACSKPETRPANPERNLELLGTAAPDSAVVSPLEVGHGMPVPVLTRRSPRGAPRSARVASAQALREPELSPKVQATTVASMAAPALSEIPVPAGPLALASATGGGNGHAEGRGEGHGSGAEPTILIRGGMGGARDDCKLYGMGRAGGGVFINRLIPPPRGAPRMARSFVGPVRIR